MLFNSLQFLCFFPLVCLGYFWIPDRVKYLWLLAASYYFYMCWNARYALLMTTSILITYFSGLLIGNTSAARTGMKKIWVALSFCSNLAILVFFKYSNFLVDSFQNAAGLLGVELNLPVFDVLLPVGISFYTFQALSYTVDVYREEIKPERNVLRYALFVSFFPQLVAGPIERSTNLLHQLRGNNRPEWKRIKAGLLLMLWGYFEKMVLADQTALVVDRVFEEYLTMNGAQLAFATALFALQIYCDFSGYSHIAIGAAQVMGFSLMQNFRQPYFAVSVQDFWRRWHISLSTWFRDYLYIPLGGNRKGPVRRALNLMITFVVSGLWHGAAWTYVVWGALNGAFQLVGGWTRPTRSKLRALMHIREKSAIHRMAACVSTFLLIDFTWLFFRAQSLTQASGILKKILCDGTILRPQLQWFLLRSSEEASLRWLSMLGACALILLCASILRERGVSLRLWLLSRPWWVQGTAVVVGVVVVLVFGVYGGNYDATQFVYFQF